MPDSIKFSELNTAEDIGGGDIAALAVENQQAETGYASRKVTLQQIGGFLNNGLEYTTALNTDDKKPIGAINELLDRIYDMFPTKSFSPTPLATLPDSANNVPMKSLTVNIVPKETGTGTKSPSNPYTISGTDTVTITRAGKNLVNIADATITSQTTLAGNVILKPATYTYSAHAVNTNAVTGRFRILKTGTTTVLSNIDIVQNTNTRVSNSFTVTEETSVSIIATGQAAGYNFSLSDIMLEAGSIMTDYEAYETPTTHTIALGQTIYGGEVDVVSGSGTETQVKITFDGSSDEYWSTYLSRNGFYINIPDMETSNGEIDYSCNYLKVTSNWEENCGIRYGANNKFIYCLHIIDNLQDVTDVATWRTYLSNNPLVLTYPLATPIPITTTPTAIKTTGYDNVSADCGDVEGEYRADIQKYIDGQ